MSTNPNPRAFAAHRALARALARLAPFYREQAVGAVASALADGQTRTVGDLRPILSDAEFARACAEAVRIHRSRDATTFDLAVQRCKGAIVGFAKRCLGAHRRDNGPTAKGRPATNT